MDNYYFHKGSKDYLDKIVSSVEQAKAKIDIILYTLNPSSAGERLVEALCNASNRGVSVNLLLDAVGSEKLTKAYEQKILDHNIELQYFNRVRLSKIQNIARRIHVKLFIFDREKAFVGGINISDEYFGVDGKQAWLDYAVEIEGESCKKLYLKTKRYFSESDKEDIASDLFLVQDFWRGKNEINRTIKHEIGAAKEKVVLLTPYFFPPRFLSRAIKKALKRGVKVHLILSKNLDIPILSRAMKYYYSSLLQMGVNLYEWTGPMLHAKLIVIDGKWTCVGSFNLDHLSSFNNVELNLSIRDSEFNKAVNKELEQNVYRETEEIKLEEWTRKHNLLMRLVTGVVYFGLIILRQILIRRESKTLN